MLQLRRSCSALLARQLSRALQPSRHLASEAGLEDDAILVLMPQLSPSMVSGKVSKWLRQPGEQVKQYDILFELETETLTEPQNKIGDMEGSVTMLVESQEDVFLQRILVDEGRELEVGTPVAVACEFEESLEALKEYTVPSKQDADKARTLSWQSYLQSGTETPGGCS